MKHQIVCVRDIVADVFGVPEHTPNIGSAIRSFGDACTKPDPSPQDIISRHPADFELYHLGEYDDDGAVYTLLEKPKQIAVGANYKK